MAFWWKNRGIRESERRIEVGSEECRERYPDNKVVNSKYTMFTFLPKNFFEQFERPLNRYFLMIALLQFISIIAPVSPLSTVLPLLFAFTLTAIKEGHDDYKRHQQDRAFNNRQYDVLKDGVFTSTLSRDIRVGDVIKVAKGDELPCDLFLLKSSDPDGQAYIRTDNLDGEIDLKPRNCVDGLNQADPAAFSGILTCEPPNPKLYTFNARLETPTGCHSVSSCQLLLQSCFLQNTEWVYGVAVYTGPETKCGMNKEDPPLKWASVDKAVSQYSIRVLFFQLTLAFVMGILGNIELATDFRNVWYLSFGSIPWWDYAVIPMRFFLLTSVMIPISFKVIIDISKYYISLAIGWDVTMYDPNIDAKEGGSPAVANNTAIAEDLGQIQRILTDKTGTLTDNVMEFKACSLDGEIYGGGDGPAFDTAVSPFDGGSSFSLRKDAPFILFARTLALCHTVNLEQTREGAVLAASSPDEEALVNAARRMNVEFCARTKTSIEIRYHPSGRTERYEILHTFEFSSDRKMMSLLLRNEETGVISLFSKGADDKMLTRIRPSDPPASSSESSDSSAPSIQKFEKHLRTFASAGLRTLVLGHRIVSEKEYVAWKQEQEEASRTTGEEREVAEEAVYAKMETGLSLVGATAIEDKLQDGVPDTIERLRRAGISFWMLTGDKFETAKQISRSCGLWAEGEGLLELLLDTRLDSSTARDKLATQLEEQLQRVLRSRKVPGMPPGNYGTFSRHSINHSEATGQSTTTSASVSRTATPTGISDVTQRRAPKVASPLTCGDDDECQGFALIVTGRTLELLLEEKKLQERFSVLCANVNSVICCRVTPGQKAEVTRMAKGEGDEAVPPGCTDCCGLLLPERGTRVLGVGDGGNDVMMIQEATIGVGIVGKEGRQASRAADYSIARFRFLQQLLLVHGQYSYQRSCYIAQYCFYKSVLLAFIQILYNFFAGFSGVSYWNSLLLTAWNGAFTLPAPFLFVLDRVVPRERLLSSPELYQSSQQGLSLTGNTFAQYLCTGILQAVVCLMATLFVFNGDFVSRFGEPMDFMPIFTVTYTVLIMVQVWVVVLDSHSLTLPNLLAIFLMPFLYVAFIAAYSAIEILDYHGVADRLFPDPAVWLTVIVLTVGLFMPSLFLRSYNLHFEPTKLQEAYLRSAQVRRTASGPAYSAIQSSSVLQHDGSSKASEFSSIVGRNDSRDDAAGVESC